MKKTISIFFIILLTGVCFPQEIKWFDGTIDEAKVEAQKQNKYILIDFFSKSG